MNRLIARITVLLALTASVWPGVSLGADPKPATPKATPFASQTGADWLQLAPEGEEFSVLSPALPSLMVFPSKYAFEIHGEMVLERDVYSGYANDFVFIVESYKVSHPQKVFERVVQNATGRASYKQDVMVDGIVAKEYLKDNANFSNRILCLSAKKHIYVVTLAARDANSLSPERFLNSFRVSDQSAQRTPVQPGQPPSNQPVVAGPVLTGREVTQKAVIVWKPEASYTEQARSHHTTGRIVLKGTFGADGQVTDITVLSGLKDGLTERAIEAARNIRFFPAEKDGQPVAQQLNVEYGFNLYP